MKTKRIIASALAFIMATTVAAGSVYAAGETVTIKASKSEAKAGGEFTATISLANVPATGIMGVEFAVKYDSSVLTIKDVKAGAIASTGSDAAEPGISSEVPSFYADYSTAGTINLSWSTGLDDKSYWIAKDGELVTITGTVAEGAAAGEYPIEIQAISRDDISGTNSSIYLGYIDENNKSVEYGSAVEAGAVIIVAETEPTTTTTTTTTTDTAPVVTTTTTTTTATDSKPVDTTTTTSTTTTTTTTKITPVGDVYYGDVNLDGGISMVDLVYLNKSIANLISLNDQQKLNADVKNDSNIASSDAQVLLQYLLDKINSLPQ